MATARQWRNIAAQSSRDELRRLYAGMGCGAHNLEVVDAMTDEEVDRNLREFDDLDAAQSEREQHDDYMQQQADEEREPD